MSTVNETDDNIIYQQKEESSFTTWLAACLGSSKPPKWIYNDPTPLLSSRGLGMVTLKKEIQDINEISVMVFNDTYSYHRFLNKFSILFIILSLVLISIPDKAIQTFLFVSIIAVIFVNIVRAIYIKPLQTALIAALDSVSEHVEVILNHKYESENIYWVIAEKIQVKECLSNVYSFNITISCSNEIFEDSKEEKQEDSFQNDNVEENDIELSNVNTDNQKNDNAINSPYHKMESLTTSNETDEIIDMDLSGENKKNYQLNWAQTVGKKRDTWVDPYVEKNDENVQEEENQL